MLTLRFSDFGFSTIGLPSKYSETLYNSGCKKGFGVAVSEYTNIRLLPTETTMPPRRMTKDFGFIETVPSPVATDQRTRWRQYNNCLHQKLDATISVTIVDGVLETVSDSLPAFEVPYRYFDPGDSGVLPSGCLTKCIPFSSAIPTVVSTHNDLFVANCIGCVIFSSNDVRVTLGADYLYPVAVVSYYFVRQVDGRPVLYRSCTQRMSVSVTPDIYSIYWPNLCQWGTANLHFAQADMAAHIGNFLCAASDVGRGSYNLESYRVLERWFEGLQPKNFASNLVSLFSCEDETELMGECIKSFRIKDATLLRELMDTMSDLATIAAASVDLTLTKLLDILKQDLKNGTKHILKNSANYTAGKYLESQYAIKAPLSSLKAWKKAYRSLTSMSQLEKSVSPEALRAQDYLVSTRHSGMSDLPSLRAEARRTLIIGLKPHDDWREFINASYRFGLLLSFADAWDLVPLSFVVDWLADSVQDFMSVTTCAIDQYRLNMWYAGRSWKIDSQVPVRLPALSSLGAGYVVLPIKVYAREYSSNIPHYDYIDSLIQEENEATLSTRTLPSALALLVSFLTGKR